LGFAAKGLDAPGLRRKDRNGAFSSVPGSGAYAVVLPAQIKNATHLRGYEMEGSMSEQAAAGRRSQPSSWPVQTETLTGLDVSQPVSSVVPEKYIPVDRSAVIERTLSRLFDSANRPLAGQVVRYMCAIRQAETARLLDELVTAYDPFNPDDETVNSSEISAAERKIQLEALKQRVKDLVEGANYNEINHADLERIFKQESAAGFLAEVDLAEYDFNVLYYRGAVKDQIMTKSWKTLWLWGKPVDVPAFRRLFIGLKLKPVETRIAELVQKGMSKRKARKRVLATRNNKLLEGVSEQHVHFKIFRRIPRHEVDILFPNARIKFTLFDTIWLWVGSGGSTAFAIVMAGLKFVAAVAVSLAFVAMTIAGAAGAVMRSVSNFFNTQTRYMAKLAQSLYFHSIASNQSVLGLLADDAEEEDIMEAIITYAVLLRYGHRGLDGVKAEAERFLKEEFDVDVAFDVEDGCNHLRKLGLLVEGENQQLHIRDLADAREHLIATWQVLPMAN
jgi:hypothetical protein